MARLPRLLRSLRRLYGAPPPPITDPFAVVLYENVAYLANDDRRDEAFRMLREATGLSPARILAAPREKLLALARKGILAEDRVRRLRQAAEIAIEEFGGDLDEVVRRPVPQAMKALRRFPSIGEPGAEKILLFTGRVPVLALESNGLRALLRIGYGKEGSSYSASYRSAQRLAQEELPRTCRALIEARELLRRHGQVLCRRASPLCERCPIAGDCAYFRTAGLR